MRGSMGGGLTLPSMEEPGGGGFNFLGFTGRRDGELGAAAAAIGVSEVTAASAVVSMSVVAHSDVSRVEAEESN